MARTNTVRVSDKEKEIIKKVRQEEFGTDSVPLGEIIEVACRSYLDD